MNKIIGGCLILLCTGCVSVTDVVPVGKDKYTVSSEMVMNFPSWSEVKQLSLKHANKFCNGKGQYMEVVGWNLHGRRGWTPLNAELIFLCLTAAAPEHPENPERIKSNNKDAVPVARGSGFVISHQGHVLTNHHVIEGCTTIQAIKEGRTHLLTVVGTDTKNDLAILTLPAPFPNRASFRAGRTIRPGDGVVVVGFPLHGLLASEANVTTGTVSALAGIGNDTRFLQIAAPVQSGNSGGPLLDEGGHIVGVVVSKLNALYIAKEIGEIPQNINFAIKDTVAKSFLDSQSVAYETGTSSNTLEFADIGAAAKKYTLLLECLR